MKVCKAIFYTKSTKSHQGDIIQVDFLWAYRLYCDETIWICIAIHPMKLDESINTYLFQHHSIIPCTAHERLRGRLLSAQTFGGTLMVDVVIVSSAASLTVMLFRSVWRHALFLPNPSFFLQEMVHLQIPSALMKTETPKNLLSLIE
jgi:hypothetical protein